MKTGQEASKKHVFSKQPAFFRRYEYLWKKPSFAFMVLMLISLFALAAVFLFTRGNAMEHFWFYSTIDTGMDFFHSIEYVRGRWPYKIFETLYPPLTNLFFLFIYAFIPESVTENWTYDFTESVNMRQTAYDLRTYQSCFMMFLFFVVLVTFMLAILVSRYLRKKGIRCAGACALGFVLSYGVLQALERGNIVILAAGFSLFFVSFYRSDNKILKELALISLAAAAGLKVYPCLLGVLILKEKDFSAAIRTVLYGIAAFILPCFAFREGLEAIPMWLTILINHTNSLEEPWLGIGISNAFADGAHLIDMIFGSSLADSSFGIAGIVVAVFFLISSLFLKKTWMSALAITFAMLFQDQGSYFFCMALIPLMLFLGEEKEFTRENSIPFLVMMTMTLPLPLLYTYNVSNARSSVFHIAILIFLIWSITDLAKNGLKEG
ncbi:MAG: glycosyltransferase 87 family protein [Lachnospiraceae bacterium]|nr:glycosyltransferase 87 family protein [Lachnospiraceae bacterium]